MSSESFIVLSMLRWCSIMSSLLILGKNTSISGRGNSDFNGLFWCKLFSVDLEYRRQSLIFSLHVEEERLELRLLGPLCAHSGENSDDAVTHVTITKLIELKELKKLPFETLLNISVTMKALFCIPLRSSIWSYEFSSPTVYLNPDFKIQGLP